ncbi:electron transfer flavoprotein beta subunit lysine methyltransferase-like [Mizuhopecten yessoensis]|uniref:ETFB lysine methyltransferase n=1 Tax=Mizuhopecten yessoensis TaxID=6573 RepID=A0A210Q6L2_MIZYE|nr:electron transfer flavoprotein beta subunit lysine methyltransferase-like [Mizuhopecten yessoensis]XP_021365999.1 electron transfer flavoprotein beta subunit lysine methyltransferase-like [Mizuhopecten yessoensis]OWF44329.1 Methyltransferase-like protein 20 [Mizuhopecten yessoensis]
MITMKPSSCILSLCSRLVRTKTRKSDHFKMQMTFSCLYMEKHHFSYSMKSPKSTHHLIREMTEVSRDHLSPEIGLHLVTPNCPLWHSRGDQCPLPDPFWAFYWPGGQALTRFILDNADLFCGRTVVDVGCGCGASSIACRMVGASHVIANDIDTVAADAISLNADLNRVSLTTVTTNLIGSHNNRWDIVLLGDMFYDMEFAETITKWVISLHSHGVSVFIGDPGRLPLVQHPLKADLKMVAEYPLPENCLKENNGLSSGFVWKYEQEVI